MNSPSQIACFPVSFFAASMGLLGLALAFMATIDLLEVTPWFFQITGLLALIVFGLSTIVYSTKIFTHYQAFRAEWQNPVSQAFFPTFSIALLLTSMLFSNTHPVLAAGFWYAGAAMQLVLTLLILSALFHRNDLQISQINPAWFIPAVGNIIVPIGAISFATIEVGWFFFSVGLLFWLILKTLILYRLFFYEALNAQLKPSLFIFIAPPAMGFLSYIALNEFVLDGIAYFLFSIALFMTLLLLTQAKQFTSLPFSLGWWAFTFPLAAMTNASFLMYELHGSVWFGYLAALLIALLTTLVVHNSIKTLMLFKNKQLCPKASS